MSIDYEQLCLKKATQNPYKWDREDIKKKLIILFLSFNNLYGTFKKNFIFIKNLF